MEKSILRILISFGNDLILGIAAKFLLSIYLLRLFYLDRMKGFFVK